MCSEYRGLWLALELAHPTAPVIWDEDLIHAIICVLKPIVGESWWMRK